jgi:iron complex transport system permease protein
MKYGWLLVLLAVAALGAFVVALLVGPAGLDAATSLAALVGRGNEAAILVMQEIRLPRAILGVTVGATLGLSGAALQGYLRNPLADPGVLGISASASLGAVLALYTGLAAISSLALPFGAMAGAVISVMLIQALAGTYTGTLSLILSGVAVGSFASAATMLALNLSPNPFASLEIVFWMLGSLSDRSMEHVWLALPFMAVGSIALFASARGLDALTLGGDVAMTLGADVGRVRTLVIVGTAVAVGGATSIAGSIGFVGLVVPHMLRPLVGQWPSRLLVASALGGATLVSAADVAVRLIAPGRDIKIGVLTALIGAPFFVWLVIKTRRQLP